MTFGVRGDDSVANAAQGHHQVFALCCQASQIVGSTKCVRESRRQFGNKSNILIGKCVGSKTVDGDNAVREWHVQNGPNAHAIVGLDGLAFIIRILLFQIRAVNGFAPSPKLQQDLIGPHLRHHRPVRGRLFIHTEVIESDTKAAQTRTSQIDKFLDFTTRLHAPHLFAQSFHDLPSTLATLAIADVARHDARCFAIAILDQT